MKLIIAGGRNFSNEIMLSNCCDYFFLGREVTEVVCGDAPGADKLGENYATLRGIRVKHFPADWDKYGKAAGPNRNGLMAAYADAAIVFWDGQSRGSKNMIDTMIAHKKPVIIIPY